MDLIGSVGRSITKQHKIDLNQFLTQDQSSSRGQELLNIGKNKRLSTLSHHLYGVKRKISIRGGLKEFGTNLNPDIPNNKRTISVTEEESQDNDSEPEEKSVFEMDIDEEIQETEPLTEQIISTETYHLEPPQTKIDGICDAPLESSVPVIPDIDEDALLSNFNLYQGPNDQSNDVDLQVHTYLHPSLIGRLPVIWLPGRQSQRIVDARQEQSQKQIEIWRKVVGRQRLGLRAMSDQVELEIDETSEEYILDNAIYGIHTRRNSEVRNFGTKFRSFVDGLTSWAQIQMS